jgi:hypothetical protein
MLGALEGDPTQALPRSDRFRFCADLFNLVADPTPRRKMLYVVGLEQPLRFLANRRALTSVMSRNSHLAKRFHDRYGDRFTTVRDYYESVRDQVEIVDIAKIVPGLSGSNSSCATSS